MADYISPLDNSEDSPLPLGFTEFKDSGQEEYDFDAGEINATRIFDGPWENRHEFLFNHILVNVSNVSGNNVYSDPQRYPGIPSATAYKASIKGLLKTGKGEDNEIKHDIARITVNYKTHNFSQGSGSGNSPDDDKNTYLEESLDTSVEILPISGEKIRYKSDHNYDAMAGGEPPANVATLKRLTEEVHFNKVIIIINYKLTIPLDLAPRWGAITAALGKVNTVPIITPSRLIADRFRLRYDGISAITKRELANGSLAWSITHAFAFKAEGWNTRPRVNDDGELENASIIPRLYEYYDLRLIFRNVPLGDMQNQLNAWFLFRTNDPLGQAFVNGTLTDAQAAQLLAQFNHFQLKP